MIAACEAIITIRPPPASSMRRPTSRATTYCPLKLTSMMRRQSAKDPSSAGAVPPMPALLINTSMRPHSAATDSIVRVTSASSVMSTSRARTAVPRVFPTSATFGDLSRRTNLAPRSANSSEIASPIPFAAPVTRTVLPEKSNTRSNARSFSVISSMLLLLR